MLGNLISVAHAGGQGKTTLAQLLYIWGKQAGGHFRLAAADFLDESGRSKIGKLYPSKVLEFGTGANLTAVRSENNMNASVRYWDELGNLFLTGGYILDVEADASTNKVYITTQSQHPSPDATYNGSQNGIWWVDGNATGGTAVKVTLTGFADSALFYPGDMTLDPATRMIYVESEQSDGTSADDLIYVFQLDAGGTTASYVKTISPGLAGSASNIGGLFYDNLPELAISAETDHALEQTNFQLLIADPTITDIDGNHLASATVKISGSFSGSGDQLSVAGTTSGVISGTSITVTITTDGKIGRASCRERG